jgi:DNA repair exonuclease SbcCD nuclease subunit
MKVAIITDQHFGARNDAISFLNFYEKFYDNTFFPAIDANGIDTVLILGDTFDRRKYVNFYSLDRAKKMFFAKLAERNIDVHMLAGNHDTYFKNTNAVNSPELLLQEYSNINVIDNPMTIDVHGIPICMVPWICAENYEESMKCMKETSATICMGHFEISGFAMYKGMESHEGLSRELFNSFDTVFSGHYHHRSSNANISYLGNPYELTWSDYNDPRGFHLFDLSTRELEFIENPYRMFHKIHYDDKNKTIEDCVNLDFDYCKDGFIKVIVHNKTNPYWFDLFIEKLEKLGVSGIQVVDDNLNLGLEDDDQIINQAEDVLTILRKYVDSVETSVDNKEVYKLMNVLYNEALSIGNE